MCGIAGLVKLEGNITPDDIDVVYNMSSRINHRGPDQAGQFSNQKIALRNNRLAIQDLSTNGNLPFISSCQNYVLCFNGEVSNFKELRLKYHLNEKYAFKSHSDSEVLLYLLIDRGESVLSELTGMFSFCFYDISQNSVLIARDPFGIVPLFYFRDETRFYFCSEIKGILESPEVERKVNPKALYDFLSLAYVPGEQTMFQDIFELRNGQKINIDLKTGKILFQYFHHMKYEVDTEISFSDAKAKVRKLFQKSVERNLISDAPIGASLSGGMDISGIVCMAKSLGLSDKIHTFSIEMDEASFEESKYQKIVAEYCKTKHHKIKVNANDVLSQFRNHLVALDEPLGDGAAIPLFILSKKAKEHVKVLLSGEGGDEVFNAYHVYKAWKINQFYKSLTIKPVRKFIKHAIENLPVNHDKISFDFKAKRFTEGADLHPAAAHIYWRHPFTNREKNKILTNTTFEETDDLMIECFNKNNFSEELNKITNLDFNYYLVDDLLLKNDRMLFAHSIEGRYPYLDKDLVDFCQTLPVEFKLKGFNERYIQKKAFEGIVPNEIIRRKKHSLEMPHSKWFFTGFRPLIEEYLSEDKIKKIPFLNWNGIQMIKESHFNKKRDYGRGLWCLISFIAWYELYILTEDYKRI